MATTVPDATEHGSLASLIPSWERSLRAANKNPRTLRATGTRPGCLTPSCVTASRHGGRHHHP